MDKHPEQYRLPNKEFVNQSLINQIANLSLQIAEREAVITEQYQEIEKLKSLVKKLRKKETEAVKKK